MKTDIIYHNTISSFELIDRIRILFGKEVHVDSKIETKGTARITGESESMTYVDKILPRKLKKGLTDITPH